MGDNFSFVRPIWISPICNRLHETIVSKVTPPMKIKCQLFIEYWDTTSEIIVIVSIWVIDSLVQERKDLREYVLSNVIVKKNLLCLIP